MPTRTHSPDAISSALQNFQTSRGEDSAARDLLVGHYYPTLKNQAIRFFSSNDRAAAEDALHGFLDSPSGFFRSLEKWKPDSRSLDNFVGTLFNQYCLNQRRAVKTRREIALPDEEVHPAFIARDHPEYAHVQNGVARIVSEIFIDAIAQIEPQKYRRFFQLHFFFEAHLTRQEMARLLGVPLGTLGAGIKRAMDAFIPAFRLRLKQRGLDPEDVRSLAGHHISDPRNRALNSLKPSSLRKFIMDVMHERSALVAAEKHGISSDKSLDHLTAAIKHFMKHSSYRGRRKQDFFARLARIDSASWLKLASDGFSGDHPQDLLYRQFRALVHGRPLEGLRDRVLSAAGPKSEYAKLASKLRLTPAKLAAFIAGVSPLSEPTYSRIGKMLSITRAELHTLEQNDRLTNEIQHTRSRRISGRKLLALEWRAMRQEKKRSIG